MRRLYLQIYLAIVAILIVFAALAATAWHHGLAPQDHETLNGAASLIAERLPSGDDPAVQHEALRSLASTLDLDLSLWSAEGQAIAWIGQQKALIPDRPFFIYFAPGATHAPHHVPREWADKYKGKFDKGWDALREETFDRQKRLGVIPKDAELTEQIGRAHV